MLLFAGLSFGHEDTSWLSGKELKQSALVEINASWSDSPIRPLLLQLSRAKKIPLFIDRRVDPSTKITFTAAQINWEQLLSELGKLHGYGFCRLDGIYYFGPAETAICLPDRYYQLQSWISKNRQQSQLNWRKQTVMKWERLSQPRMLLKELARENGIELFQMNVPLDLWPESNLPDVSLLLKSVLLCVGFEKWLMISKSGTKMKLIDFPSSDSVEFKLNNIRNSKNLAAKLNNKYENLNARAAGSNLTLKGSASSLSAALPEAIQSQQVLMSKATSTSTYTADFKGLRGSILATMAQELSLKLEYEQSTAEQLGQHIEFSVVNETANQIISRALEGTGLKYRIESGLLEIYR